MTAWTPRRYTLSDNRENLSTLVGVMTPHNGRDVIVRDLEIPAKSKFSKLSIRLWRWKLRNAGLRISESRISEINEFQELVDSRESREIGPRKEGKFLGQLSSSRELHRGPRENERARNGVRRSARASVKLLLATNAGSVFLIPKKLNGTLVDFSDVVRTQHAKIGPRGPRAFGAVCLRGSVRNSSEGANSHGRGL